MGPWGAVIMSFFGGVFFVAAGVIGAGWKNPLLVIPCLVFVIMAAIARSKIKNAPAGFLAPSAKARKIIIRATIFEGVGIPVVANVLANTGHGDILLPGVALVVGLHFLPMAYAIPFRPFYACAALLILAAAAGADFPQPMGSMITGFAASLVLWMASIFALNRKPV